jgi:exosortase
MSHMATARAGKTLLLRGFVYLSYTLGGVLLFMGFLRRIYFLSFEDKLYSHISLVPLISGVILYQERKKIFRDISYSAPWGVPVVATGVFLYFLEVSGLSGLEGTDHLILMAFSFLLYISGGFVFFFGTEAARRAAFPLLFLLFMVPIPSAIADRIIRVLQNGSAEVANGLFALTGVPYFREGFTFHLSSLSIEVAPQCSGIRSTLALFITSVLAGHLFLRTGWKKAVLSLSIFPITIFKNGLRIVTLTLLGAYVDPRILSSSLHRKGGIPFFILALAIFMPILWYLRKTEKSKPLRSESE